VQPHRDSRELNGIPGPIWKFPVTTTVGTPTVPKYKQLTYSYHFSIYFMYTEDVMNLDTRKEGLE
jgi:hypothetical protein